jgi:predicted alpha/beta-fold hydrolase
VHAVGVSMGGIVLANYVSRSGPACALASGVCLSGALRLQATSRFNHARRLWHPILTQSLKGKFLAPCVARLRARGVDLGAVLDAKDVFEFDERLVSATFTTLHLS